jgi:hypothetical protein
MMKVSCQSLSITIHLWSKNNGDNFHDLGTNGDILKEWFGPTTNKHPCACLHHKLIQRCIFGKTPTTLFYFHNNITKLVYGE